MYVYADLLIILNTIVNTIILCVTAKLASRRFTWCSLVGMALGTSVYSLGEVIYYNTWLYSGIFKLLLSVLIIIISFGYCGLRSLIWSIGVFYIVSFVLGGAVLGWLYLLEEDNNPLFVSQLWGASCTWVEVICGCLCGAMIIMLVYKGIIVNKSKRRMIYSLYLSYKENTLCLPAWLDTGNRLYTLTGHHPVILIDFTSALQLVGNQVKEYLCATPAENWVDSLQHCTDIEWMGRVEIIPYRSVGIQNLLLGFRPDSLALSIDDTIIHYDKVVVGIVSKALSSDGRYSALLHADVLNTRENLKGA